MDIKDKHKSECIDDGSICSPEAVIKQIGNVLKVSGTTKSILEKSKAMLDCDSESCVVSHSVVASVIGERVVLDIKERHFKPYGPRNNTNLLDNFNIDLTLNRWETQYDKFYHIYYQMIDFDIVKSELANIDICDVVKRGYNSLGVVLNTDVSTGGGIHWFCLFCDFTASPITLEYFNSSGNLPRKEVQAWLVRANQQLIHNKYDSKIVIASRIVHQEGDTECGPYSLYYIWSRLNKVPHTVFDKVKISDEKMIEFRKTLFRDTK